MVIQPVQRDRRAFIQTTTWNSQKTISLENMVVYHLEKVSGKPGWVVNGTRLLGSFQGKILGGNRKSEKVDLFFRTELMHQTIRAPFLRQSHL